MTEKNAESIGIMDPAFFVGKNILIKWVNDLLNINIQKVEEMATGAYYCQLLDMIYRDPPAVALSKVNFGAKYDYEYVKNWNVLQVVFTTQGIQKYVDVGKLVKAKYQDNLEFFQWFKSWFDSKYNGSDDYDPKARREAAIKSKGGKLPAPSAIVSKPVSKAPSKPAVVAKPIKPASTTTTTAPANTGAKKTTPTQPAKTAPKATTKSPAKGGGDEKEVGVLNAQLDKLKQTVEGLEKERNFYFGKLRSIEVLCQQDEHKDIEITGKILQVLYSTEEEEKAPEETSEPSAETGQTETATNEEQPPAEENLLQGVNEGELVSAEEPASF